MFLHVDRRRKSEVADTATFAKILQFSQIPQHELHVPNLESWNIDTGCVFAWPHRLVGCCFLERLEPSSPFHKTLLLLSRSLTWEAFPLSKTVVFRFSQSNAHVNIRPLLCSAFASFLKGTPADEQ